MSQSSVALFELSAQVPRTTQVGLGEMLGVSRRTAQRGAASGVPSYEMRRLAELVHPVNPNLAMQIAASLGTTLETLGIVKPVRRRLGGGAEALETVRGSNSRNA